jgi:hypothetical protein
VKPYETLEAYQADQGPVREKMELLSKQRLEAVPEVTMNLFGIEETNGHQAEKRRK